MIAFPPQDGVVFVKNVMIPMSDGTHLAMDLHVPQSDDWQKNATPLILEYIPYRKDDAAPYSGYQHIFAQHGFIGARLDCRGTGSSEGINTDEYTELEQQDAVEAIEWIAQQSWCTGKIGMIGASYGGFTCVQVAAHNPEHLTTIIPIYFTDDRYTDDCHYRGGAWRCYYDIGAYGASMIGMNAMPPYPEYSGGAWARIWEQHLEHNTPYLLEWMAHQTDGPYWRPGSIRGRYEDIECPVFMIGGWRDGYPNPPLRCFAHMQVPKRLLMGPWNHSRPDVAIPGPRIDYVAEVVRWCDYWLKGEDNGVMDEEPVCVYVQSYDEPRADRLDTSGYWRVERDLRPSGSEVLHYMLCEHGRLSEELPAVASTSDHYEYRPTVGLAGGLWSGGVPFGLPTDQRIDEIHSLNYTSTPLAEPLEIFGRPRCKLHISSTAPVMCFVARLCDVAPDGNSALVCTGVLNATRRNSLTDPEPLEEGEIYELDIELDGTAWRFAAGHSVRLSICSADFPNLWPTPYKGENRVYRDRDYPSQLALPVVPTRAVEEGEMPVDERNFKPGQAGAIYQEGPDEPVWQVVHDLMGDRTGLKTVQRKPSKAGADMEMTYERVLEVWASNRDPADVVAVGKHLRHIVRRDFDAQVDASCTLRSTLDAFHMTIDLHILFNGLPHYQKRWVQSFERNLL
jgi:hypothetical protein